MLRRAFLVNHIFERFGKTRLDALTRPLIERWLVDLAKANQTKNHILYALKTVLAEAHAEGLITSNPLEHAEPLGKQARKRDVFSLEELQALFPFESQRALQGLGQFQVCNPLLDPSEHGDPGR